MSFESVMRGSSQGTPLRSVIWAGLASVLLQAGIVGSSIAAARTLGIEEFGKFSLVVSTSAMFLGLATSGLGIASTRYAARYAGSDPKRAGRILALASLIAGLSGVLAALIVLLMGRFLANSVYHQPALTNTLKVSAVYLLFSTHTGYQIGAAVGLRLFRQMAFLNGVQACIAVLLVRQFALYGGVPAAVLATGLAAASAWVHYHFIISRCLKALGASLNYRHCRRELDVFRSFAMPSAMAGIVTAVSSWAAATLLSRSPAGLRQLALFNAAAIFRQIVLFAPVILQRVFAPSFSEMYGRADRSAMSDLLLRSALYCCVSAASVATVLIFFRPFILTLFGRDFKDPDHVALWVLLFALCEVTATAIYQILPAAGMMWWQAAVTVIWSVALLAATRALAPLGGAAGLAKAYSVAWALAGVVYMGMSILLLGRRYAAGQPAHPGAA